MFFAMTLLMMLQQPNISPSVEGLAARVPIGRSIRVMERDGTHADGQFAGTANGAVQLRVKGNTREIPTSLISTVQVRRPESAWNGALIGAGIGALTAIVATSGGDDPEQAFYERAAFTPLFASIGLGAGALIDFAIRRYETVVQVSPIVSKSGTGVLVRFAF